jgi:uracil-DNA glycosylase family 4
VAQRKRRAYLDFDYWGKPVPGFGDLEARVLVVGLAPGAHGANRTGRMFTGDGSGEFLFRALHKAGFANQAVSRDKNDGLELMDLYVSAVCRCAPPANQPTPVEIANCLPFLEEEIRMLARIEVIVALGRLAFDNVLRICRRSRSKLPRLDFTHAGAYSMGSDRPALVASYHPSRQNTQTGRLTEAMFDSIWDLVRALVPVK